MLLNYGAREDSWESPGQQGDQTSQSWILIRRTDAKAEAPIFDHLIWTADSREKALKLGKTEGRRGWQRMRWLDGIIDSVDMNLGRLWETVRDREAWLAAVHAVVNSCTRPGNWTTTIFEQQEVTRYLGHNGWIYLNRMTVSWRGSGSLKSPLQ